MCENHYFVFESLELDSKYTSKKIRSIGSSLTWIKILSYLSPIRITGERCEEVRRAVLAYDGHRIVITLAHVSRRALKRRRENDRASDIEMHATSCVGDEFLELMIAGDLNILII